VVEPPLRVGFAGLGLMGLPMARNLAGAGLLEGVYNRTQLRAADFAAETGVRACSSPAELAERANVLVTMVADDDASWEVFAGDGGFAETIRPGSVAVQMSTVSLQHVEELAELLGRHGCSLLDVPVSGSVSMAEQATLTLMAGGAEADLAAVEPVLRVLGSSLFHLGPLGAGAVMKLAVNAVVYGLNGAVAEGLVLAERAGIERARAYEVFMASAAAAPFVHYRQAAFERPEEAPVSLRLELAAKDLGLIIDLAAELGQPLPQTELNAEIVAAAVAEGFADSDLALVAEYLRRDGHRPVTARKESS
jgi:3-hydroxyisobutyrate dehydrogenase-like beta-hydroxyacid dehydrogenase